MPKTKWDGAKETTINNFFKSKSCNSILSKCFNKMPNIFNGALSSIWSENQQSGEDCKVFKHCWYREIF